MGAVRFAKSIAIVAISIVALASACHDGSQGLLCTEVGCHSGADIVVNLDVTASSLDGSTVSLCYKDECFSGTIAFPESSAEPKPSPYPLYVSLGESQIVAECELVIADGGAPILQLEYDVFDIGADADVDIELDGDIVPAPIHDGDTFEVRVVAANGTTLFDQAQTAAYSEVVQPNGAVCGPTCHRAEIVMTQ